MASSGDDTDDELLGTDNGDARNVPGLKADNLTSDGEPLSDEGISEEEDRPGRFYGPDSTWRHYTEDDRAVVRALDQIECNDLSIHLYNAHAWKQRHQDDQAATAVKTLHSKSRWIKPDESGKLPFLPNVGWTAWPLKPEDVPRKSEQWGSVPYLFEEDPETISRKEQWTPSLDLQEELQAIILRKAKERFSKRTWVYGSRGSVPESEIPQTSENESEDTHEAAKMKMPRDVFELPQVHDHYTPAFTVDDEACVKLLQPTARHILTKLDHLLIGLHKSRQGHQVHRASSSRRENIRSDFRSTSPSRVSTRSAGTPSKRKRLASDAASAEEEISSLSDARSVDSTTAKRRQPRSRLRLNQHSLGPRDWSEVLGAAALVGFDQAVLDRAARRCAATFRETMSMRIMPERPARSPQDQVKDYLPDLIAPFESSSDEEFDPAEETMQSTPEWSCPYVSCIRHEQPYQTRRQFVGHLRQKHHLAQAEVDAMEVEIKAKESDDGLSSDEPAASAASQPAGEDPGEAGQTMAVRPDGFLQPITVQFGRSEDKQPRRRRRAPSTSKA